MSLLIEYQMLPAHPANGDATDPMLTPVTVAVYDGPDVPGRLVPLAERDLPRRLAASATGGEEAHVHSTQSHSLSTADDETGSQRTGEDQPVDSLDEVDATVPMHVIVGRLSELGGDERVALHRLFGAINAGDRARCLDGLELLLMTLGRVATAALVREARTELPLPRC